MIESVVPFPALSLRGDLVPFHAETRLEEYLLSDVTETIEPSTPVGPGEFVLIEEGSVDASSQRVTTAKQMLVTATSERALQRLSAGDVLVARRHPERNAVAVISPPLEGAFAATAYCVLRPRPDLLDGRYLYRWVQSPEFAAGLVRRASGGRGGMVTDASVRSMPIPLPAVREQKRIAAILDDIDQLRFQRLAALDLLAELSESLVLDAADGADPGLLSDLVETVEYGPPAREAAPSEGDTATVPVIRPSSLTNDHELDLAQLPSRRMTSANVARFTVRPGDLLLYRTRNSESAPRVALFGGNESDGSSASAGQVGLVPAPSVIRLRLRTEHASDGSGEYLKAFLAGPHGRVACRALSSLTPRTLRDLALPIPSPEARHVFAERTEELRKARTNERVQLARLDELFAVLRFTGFSGRL